MNIEALRSLQARIREAKGADRELDIAIAVAFKHRHCPTGMVHHYTVYPDGLGACVSLMHEVLPGHKWEKYADGKFCVRGGQLQWALGVKPLASDCLTFLDAIFSAKISELEATEKADV